MGCQSASSPHFLFSQSPSKTLLRSRISSLFKLRCDGQPRHVHYDSSDLTGSSHCFVTDPRPPSSSSARRTVRLASRLDGPFPCLSSGQVESAWPGFCSVSPPIFLTHPGFDVLFNSGHPTNFPTSFISSMDSL
ncbi:hypothetical protein CRENBAI_019542 [Crenichthys baileyi]|uniref:Uncharacterized protein n=1 Tax=Crenichthys baileyi TaxID=28760 RepID=A0AAV9R1U6_9TELE